jgi:anti-anti-sigma factor
MASSHILINDYAGVTVVTFTESRILDAVAIGEIAKDLYHLVDDQARGKVLLDFSKVTSMSSQGLGMLVNLNKKLAAIKGSLALCGLRPEIKKLFAITGLEKDFKFHADDKAALAAWKVNVS